MINLFAKGRYNWLLLILPISIFTGGSVALFLWLMELVNETRWNNLWLLFFLAPAGILIVWLYKKANGNLAAGNDLILGEIHEPGAGVPGRLTPLILVTTLITHLFGGSAGREGTAVQMGGGIAGWLCNRFEIGKETIPVLLMCGIAAGFGAVFGTPFAGAVFAIEVLVVGQFRYKAIVPCLIASILGDIIVRLTGLKHSTYHLIFVPGSDEFKRWISSDFSLLMKTIAVGIVFGYASRLFVFASRQVKSIAVSRIPNPWLRPVIGAALILGISYCIGSFDYLGLGVENPRANGVSIISAFSAGGAGYLSWFWKLVLTAITLGFGFRGGEVTPLFFIGATLGNVLAIITGSPVDLFAALGFLAVFAGATNTPVACTIMGMELFGTDNWVFFLVACVAAYLSSGRQGVYHAQRTSEASHDKQGKLPRKS